MLRIVSFEFSEATRVPSSRRQRRQGFTTLPRTANSYPAAPNTSTKTTATAKTLTWERRSPRAQGVSPVFRAALVQTKGLSTLAALHCKPWVIPLPLHLLPTQPWAWAKALLCEQQQQSHSKATAKEKDQ